MNELYSICWNITSKCNQKCKFCYRKHCKDNTLSQNKKIFDNLSQIKIDKITFSGGEPLMYEELFELVDYIRSKNSNIVLSITTNGKKIDDTILNKIIKKFDWITFSIDSLNETINEEIGRGQEHSEKIIQLLKKCNNKIKIKINTVASKYNINDLEDIYKTISRYNISRWKILVFWSLRNAKTNEDMFKLNDSQIKSISKFVNKKNKEKLSMKIHFNDFNEFTTSYFTVYSDGSVENMKNEEVGNLLNNDISEILLAKQNELVNHKLRNNIQQFINNN